MATVRIATVNATGKQYVVIRVDFARKDGEYDKVTVWGECTWMHGARRKHDGTKQFLLSGVTLSEVDGGQNLSVALFDQAVKSRVENGERVVRVTGRKRVNVYTERT